MSIKLVNIDTIKRPVELNAPDGSDIVIEGVEYTYLTPEQYIALANEQGSATSAVRTLIVSWGKFLDVGGKQIKPTQANIDELFESPWIALGFVATFENAIQGYDSKNFMKSLALGQMAHAQAAKKRTVKKKTRKSSTKH